MPVTALDVTPASPTANAYVSLAVADQYHLDRPAVGTTWGVATADQKTAAILWATKLLDNLWTWNGYPESLTQALAWPRKGILKRHGLSGYISSTEIPTQIQSATAEYARQLLVSDLAANSDIESLGITSLTAGPVSLSFKDSVRAKPVPDIVVNLIPLEWGTFRFGNSSFSRDLTRA